MKKGVRVEVLGMCCGVGVRWKVEGGMVMGVCVRIISGFCKVVICLLGKRVGKGIGMIVEVVVVGGLVSMVSELVKGFG